MKGKAELVWRACQALRLFVCGVVLVARMARIAFRFWSLDCMVEGEGMIF